MAVAWSATKAVETRVAATVAAAGEAAAAAAARVETAGWRRRGGVAARRGRARNGSGSGVEPRRREGGQRASVGRVEVTVARRG